MKKKCINCNEIGHIYKNCKSPLSSYGIIIFREKNKSLEYLMIQRRHTFGYVELIRTNYDENNEEYISKLLSEMTKQERIDIIERPFDELWENLWLQTKDEILKYSRDFKKCKQKFETTLSLIKKINLSVPVLWELPEWGFPKGKKNMDEDFISCAMREVFEETTIESNEYEICEELSPLEETFRGTDNKIYRHLYLVAKLKDSNRRVELDNNNILQKREVGGLRWFSLAEAVLHIRPYNREKIELIKYVDSKLKIDINSA
jgi:8-oxo-dGTP pyrophosphatase MutT (NUDIX family)